MTMMIQRVNANSPAQAVKSRARGPTITQLRAKQAALVAASELAASSDAEASVVRHSPVDEAKRWASGKGRKVGFAKARATFRGGGTGIAATAAKHDSLIKKARWRGTEQIARETPAGSVSVVTMPHRKDFASDKEHQVKFNLWLKAGGFKGKVLNGAVREPEHLARAHACVDPCRSGSSRWPRSTRSRVLTMNAWVQKQGYPPFCKVVTQVPGGRLGQAGAHC